MVLLLDSVGLFHSRCFLAVLRARVQWLKAEENKCIPVCIHPLSRFFAFAVLILFQQGWSSHEASESWSSSGSGQL